MLKKRYINATMFISSVISENTTNETYIVGLKVSRLANRMNTQASEPSPFFCVIPIFFSERHQVTQIIICFISKIHVNKNVSVQVGEICSPKSAIFVIHCVHIERNVTVPRGFT